MSATGVEDRRRLLGRRIRQARRELGVTQGELAGKIGISLGLLDRYERGLAEPSSRLARIAEATGKSPAWFTSSDYAEPAQHQGRTSDRGQEIAEAGKRLEQERRQLATMEARLEERSIAIERMTAAQAALAEARGEQARQSLALETRAAELEEKATRLERHRNELVARDQAAQQALAEQR